MDEQKLQDTVQILDKMIQSIQLTLDNRKEIEKIYKDAVNKELDSLKDTLEKISNKLVDLNKKVDDIDKSTTKKIEDYFKDLIDKIYKVDKALKEKMYWWGLKIFAGLSAVAAALLGFIEFIG